MSSFWRVSPPAQSIAVPTKAKAVRQRKLKAGEPMGHVPYGLRRDGKRNVPDPERSPIVREALKLRLHGEG